uniref:Uncharacterized protein n=1 Tax=Ditylenchus dipsaci TaxID=166011 RepID=A0A915EEU3_9BILA
MFVPSATNFLNDTFRIEPGWESIYYIYQIFFAYYLFTIMPLTIERLVATLQAKEYEKNSTPYFGIVSTLANVKFV